MLPKTADVVVIGGGVMGASTAYHLAARGIKNVILLEKAPFLGMEATGKCAGGIRYQFSTEINVRLSLLSLPMLERFEEELGQAIDLRWPGYLFLLDNEHDLAVFRQNVALQNRLGIPSRILAPAEVAARVPLLNLEGVIAAAWHDRDGLADPNGVVQGYAAGARRLGAQIFTEIEAIGIRVESGRVAAVETPAGVIVTPAVVNAAGPWAGKVAALAGVELPIVPLRRQIVVTTPLKGIPEDFPFVLDFSRSLYFHREGKGILTGQSNPHETPGFDQTIDHALDRAAPGAGHVALPAAGARWPAARMGRAVRGHTRRTSGDRRAARSGGFLRRRRVQRPRLHARPHRRPADRRDDRGRTGAQPGRA